MGKMKAMFTQMQENKELMSLYKEGHYQHLVENVAQWMVENKSTKIIDDISSRVRDLYINNPFSKEI